MRFFLFRFLILLVVLNVVVAGCKKSHSKTKVNTVAAQIIADSAQNELSILFMGDVMQHGPQIRAAYNDSLGLYDYAPCFAQIAPLAQGVDVAFANLELTLAGEPFSGYPQFSAPDNLASTLKNAGIHYLVTANNHSCDRGNSGVKRTITVLDSFGIYHTGTFLDSADRTLNNPLVIEKNGIKVALLNYTYGTNGLSVKQPLIVNYIDSATILDDLVNCKKLNADKIIVVMHWGDEYQRLPNNYQKNYARFCFENGADYIIGSHPHVLQPMERGYDSTLQKEQLVVYSLGNFVSNQRERYKDGGTMFKLVLKKEKNTQIKEAGYILTWVDKVATDGKNTYTIYPVSQFEEDSIALSKSSLQELQLFRDDSQQLFDKHNKNIGHYHYIAQKKAWVYVP